MSDPNNKVIMKEEVGFSLPQLVKKVLKKVPKKVILLKSTEEGTKKCTKKKCLS